jgi:hypothetical protein
LSTLQDKLLAQYRAQPGKVMVLAGMSVFGLLLWGRLLLKDPPRVATAEPGTPAAAEVSSTAASGTSSTTGSSVAVIQEGPEIRVTVPREGPRDLFRLPQVAQSPEPDEAAPQSRPESTDTPRRIRVRDLASGLRLQAVMLGREPRAVINGSTLREGQSVEGFRLLRVERRHVDLDMDGVVVRLGLD